MSPEQPEVLRESTAGDIGSFPGPYVIKLELSALEGLVTWVVVSERFHRQLRQSLLGGETGNESLGAVRVVGLQALGGERAKAA